MRILFFSCIAQLELHKQSDKVSIEQIQRLEKRVERERKARKEAERLLEQKSTELYHANAQLSKLNDELEQQVIARTQELVNNIKRLERINADLSEVTHVLSHDLKSPLRAIGSLMGFLEEDLKGNNALNDDIEEYLSLVRNRVGRMQNLLNGILEYVNIGNTHTVESNVAIRQILEHALRYHLQVPQGARVEFSGVFETIRANIHRIQQVFSHILENAFKYHPTPHEAIVRITGTHDPKRGVYIVQLTDNGPGIAEKYHEKIFKVFQLLESRDRNESKGIGLPIVRKIMESLDGSIQVVSALGSGATFILEFPANRVVTNDADDE